jgi:hypothetical protein
LKSGGPLLIPIEADVRMGDQRRNKVLTSI